MRRDEIPNLEKTEIKDFIRENWQIMTDSEMYFKLVALGLNPVSVEAVRKMRQREDFTNSKEDVIKKIGRYQSLKGTNE